MTDEAKWIEDAKARCTRATPGPWSVESCGEKGDGANMIGVSFGPEDVNATTPLSGWLEPYDDGNEIEYYRDELVAECDHSQTRNCGYNAIFIAHARTDLPRALDALTETQSLSLRLSEDNARLRAALLNLLAHIDQTAYRDLAGLRLSDVVPHVQDARAALSPLPIATEEKP